MKRPLFSCVIPVKGPRPYFDEALESLLSQGMDDDLEIIVQDADVEADKGQSDALNKGFAKAKGEWLFWLNADDVLLPDALGKVRDFINRVERVERVEEIAGDGDFINRAERVERVEWIAGDTVYLDHGGIARDVRTDAKWYPWLGKKLSVWTGGPSSFFRRELWERYGGFNVDLKYVMDIDLWTRWAKKGVKFKSVGRYVWGFRVHEGSKTMGGRNEKSHYEERVEVLKSHGLYKQQGWRNLTRMCSLLNGGWFKRLRDRKSFFGINWRDLTI